MGADVTSAGKSSFTQGAVVGQRAPMNDVILAELATIVSGRVETASDVRARHANTLTWIEAQPSDVVVWPTSTAELVRLVALAERFGIPLIPFGGGTSLEGHVNAPLGGICVDFGRLDRITSVDCENLLCTVEAGVTLEQLQARLSDMDVFFSVDPGAGECTLGGMAATRASGSNSVRYGTMRDNVVSAKAVLAGGEVISTGSHARKSAAGYDLTHLLVGSEGTLGFITELTLRLWPRPKSIAVAVASFPTIDAACKTVVTAMQAGLRPARIELLDGLALSAVNVHSALAMQEVPTLFLEFHGLEAETNAHLRQFQVLAADNSVIAVQVSSDEAYGKKLWRARHDAFRALSTRWPGKSVLATDVCVPISNLAACIASAQRLLHDLGLTAPIVGHVGDGNFHVLPVWDDNNEMERVAVRRFLDRLGRLAIDYAGTCSGEHGIGQGKMSLLVHESGPALEAMRRVKRALDPQNIFNPGKIFSM